MRLITVAIHTYDRAISVRSLLESEGVPVTLQNVNLEQPEVSSGVRIRINEDDLPLALRILENPEIFNVSHNASRPHSAHHSIVVPTDFSPYSYLAARVAIMLAARHRTEVTFLHSYIDPHVSANVQLSDNLTYEIAGAEAVEQLIDTSNKMMAEFTGRLKDEMKQGTLPVVRFTNVVMEGVPEDAIISYAKDCPPYLVVMGTRDSGTKERELIGSVTAEVLDECRFSVLTVPDGTDPSKTPSPSNILFFSNLDQEDILAMDTVYRYFPDSRANVTIVHIPSRHRFSDRTAGKSALALSDYCCRKFQHYKFENVPVVPKNAVAELEQLQAIKKFDLIVIPSRRKNALRRFFNPGIAHRLLFQADIPMLVIPI